MNLSELVSIAARSTGLPPKQVRQVLDNVFETMEGSLLRGDVVHTPFGSFAVKRRAAKKGWNMHTNQTIDIPAAKVVKFSASKAIKASVNSSKRTAAKKAAPAKKTTAKSAPNKAAGKVAPKKTVAKASAQKPAPVKRAAAASAAPKKAAAAKTAPKKAAAAPKRASAKTSAGRKSKKG